MQSSLISAQARIIELNSQTEVLQWHFEQSA